VTSLCSCLPEEARASATSCRRCCPAVSPSWCHPSCHSSRTRCALKPGPSPPLVQACLAGHRLPAASVPRGLGRAPPPRLQVHHVVQDDQGSDGNGRVNGAIVAKAPNGPRVHPPSAGLHPRHYFHRPHLGGPRHGARGEDCPEGVKGAAPGLGQGARFQTDHRQGGLLGDVGGGDDGGQDGLRGGKTGEVGLWELASAGFGFWPAPAAYLPSRPPRPAAPRSGRIASRLRRVDVTGVSGGGESVLGRASAIARTCLD
jgi:hypothetical protein